MSFIQRAKENIKKEIDAYKYNKQLENNPQVVRQRLANERADISKQLVEARERQQFEREKAELKQIQKESSFIGKLGQKLQPIQQHLQNVKQQKQTTNYKNKKYNASLGTGRNIIYDNKPTSMLTQDVKGARSLLLSDEKSKSSTFGHSGGVLGNKIQPKKAQKKQAGKTIVIKL